MKFPIKKYETDFFCLQYYKNCTQTIFTAAACKLIELKMLLDTFNSV